MLKFVAFIHAIKSHGENWISSENSIQSKKSKFSSCSKRPAAWAGLKNIEDRIRNDDIKT